MLNFVVLSTRVVREITVRTLMYTVDMFSGISFIYCIVKIFCIFNSMGTVLFEESTVCPIKIGHQKSDSMP